MIHLENYREQREIRGDITVLSSERDPVFIHVGPTEGQPGYDPNQGFFIYPPDEDEPHVVLDKKNLIVNQASILMAQRMQPGASALSGGIQALAVGTGVGTGTTTTPQAPDPTLTALRQELFRKLISSWTYLDANSNPTGTATNVLQLTINLAATEAVGTITEMGLFGGGTAADATTSTNMYNMVTFQGWPKTSSTTLTIIWTLTF